MLYSVQDKINHFTNVLGREYGPTVASYHIDVKVHPHDYRDLIYSFAGKYSENTQSIQLNTMNHIVIIKQSTEIKRQGIIEFTFRLGNYAEEYATQEEYKEPTQ